MLMESVAEWARNSQLTAILGFIGFGAIAYWSWLVIFSGVNYFRRVLALSFFQSYCMTTSLDGWVLLQPNRVPKPYTPGRMTKATNAPARLDYFMFYPNRVGRMPKEPRGILRWRPIILAAF
jgi:hypothetical protein